MATSKRKTTKKDSDGTLAKAPAKQRGDRVEDYRRLAERFTQEACVVLPTVLHGQARREHVRACLLEDHRSRISQQSRGAKQKFATLAKSRLTFFRGTALLFYRDMAGADSHMPSVLVLGDVHPTNFGVMPNADNVPIFGVNDFDETIYAPFTWDLKRGALGFMLAAREEASLGRKKRRKIVNKFVRGYADGMSFYAQHGTESAGEFRIDNSPKIIRKLFDEAMESRRGWLWDRYLDETGRGFRANDEFTPISSRREEFQRYIDQLAKKNNIKGGGRAGDMQVKDVAMRHGQGTASLGLDRYYVLLEGPSTDASDDLIIELKRARRSALEGLVPPNPFNIAGRHGDRITHGQSVHLARGDVFYGSVEIDGESFMSRERAPFRDDIDLDDLSYGSWKAYAKACGGALAQAHARSDEVGEIDYDIEPSIVEAMQPIELFIDDVLHFADEAYRRLKEDHAHFVRDYELGAFGNVEMTYR